MIPPGGAFFSNAAKGEPGGFISHPTRRTESQQIQMPNGTQIKTTQVFVA
jgi:hypothetical protein